LSTINQVVAVINRERPAFDHEEEHQAKEDAIACPRVPNLDNMGILVVIYCNPDVDDERDRGQSCEQTSLRTLPQISG